MIKYFNLYTYRLNNIIYCIFIGLFDNNIHGCKTCKTHSYHFETTFIIYIIFISHYVDLMPIKPYIIDPSDVLFFIYILYLLCNKLYANKLNTYIYAYYILCNIMTYY